MRRARVVPRRKRLEFPHIERPRSEPPVKGGENGSNPCAQKDVAAPPRLFYTTAQGQAVVFLHGLGCSGRYWQLRTTPLAARQRLYFPDLLGFGRSPWPVTEYTVELHVAAIRRFMEEAGLAGERVVLVGHSLGATLALEYAARFQSHVQRLILFSLPYFVTPKDARECIFLEPGVPHLTLRHPKLAEVLLTVSATPVARKLLPSLFPGIPIDVVEDATSMSWNSYLSTLEHCIIEHSPTGALGQTHSIRTCLVHGTKDGSVPFASVEALQTTFPHLECIWKEGGTHHLLLTDPEWCLALIDSRLETTPAT